MKWLVCIFCSFYSVVSFAIEDVISLSVGLQNDFVLEESFRDKKLTFKGTFSKLTQHKYNPNTLAVQFTPTKTGVGTFHIFEGNELLKKYLIDVKKTDLNRVAHEMKKLLKEIDGIHIKIINNKVAIDGEVFIPEDMKRIFKVVREYGKQATSLVSLSKSAQNKVARFMEKEIGNPNIFVKAANGRFILRGTVETEDEKKNAEIIATLYLPSVVVDPATRGGAVRDRVTSTEIINLIKVEKPPKPTNKAQGKQTKLIQLIVHYIELDKNYENQFRFNWAPSISDETSFRYGVTTNSGSQTADIFRGITGTISNFLPKLNWAKSFGFARVLHSSNLIVEDTKPGTINSTTKIPFKTLAGANGLPEVKFGETGIRGTITPTIAGERKDGVRLDVSFSFSNFLGSYDGAPIIASRSIKTIVFVRSGLSAAIGGVVSTSNSAGFNREPTGKTGEPLFNLLASKDKKRNQNQFVIFITPIIKNSASSGVERIKRKFRLE